MGIFRCKKGASKLTVIIACCLGGAIVLGGGIWGLLALRSDPVARQIDLGHKHLEEGNYPDAILAFEEAIEIDPSRHESYLALSELYLDLGKPEDALMVLESFPGSHHEIAAMIEELTRAESIAIDREKLWLVVDELWTLQVTIEPVTASNRHIQWSSNNETVAEVSPEVL